MQKVSLYKDKYQTKMDGFYLEKYYPIGLEALLHEKLNFPIYS